MDLTEHPEDVAFRADVRRWLEAHVRPDEHVAPAGAPVDDDQARLGRAKAWQDVLYRGGWAGITWPKEFGGRGGTAVQQAIFGQEEARFGVSAAAFAVGVGMVGPTLMAHGDRAQQAHLDGILRGTHVWCQLFSEPGAGSDLAALATRAVRDGDDFVVNGQKVWTSGAHQSDYGILLARTDPDVPKHQGITYLLVDMTTPGIEVRPLRQITGAAHFNEVFLTDVRIPAANVVGSVGDGWRVAVTTLANERSLIGSMTAGRDIVAALRTLAEAHGRAGDPVIRQLLARAHSEARILSFLGLRARSAARQGRPAGPESSVMKLAHSRRAAMLGDLALQIEGAGGMLAAGERDEATWHQQFLGSWSGRIGGGTDQIQQNVIGERVLGLPRDVRLDKDVPFRDVPRS